MSQDIRLNLLALPVAPDMLRATQAARQICATFADYQVTADECYQFGDIMDFLWASPSLVTQKRGRKTRPNILLDSGVTEVAERWLEGRRQIPTLSVPTTITDPAVEAILKARGFDTDDVDTHHRVAMAAENVIGLLLEKYIAAEMEHFGWVWCAGEIIRAIDFIKKTDEEFYALQIKNRSNSENSSSAAVRVGTDIKKWHRLNARNGATYWHTFPEPELVGVLTEEGFQKFIKDNLK